MKRILLIATGGTIASKPSDAGLTPAISSEELLSYVPELASVCGVTAVQPFRLDSTDVRASHWLELARIVEENYAAYDGFVVTHGTDTMAYTAAALSYLIRNNRKPVVLTGAQRSVCLRDTDARRNLAAAFFYCVDDGAQGVHVVFDDKVILGTRAKKTRTRSYNAFSSIDFPETAILRDGKPFYYIREEMPTGEPEFSHELDDKVFVLKLIPGIDASVFDYLDEHCDALVVESFGSGGLPDYGGGALLARLKRFLAAGKPAVFTTQVEREGSALDTYEVGRRLYGLKGVLEAKSMTLEATVAKLMWLLPRTHGEELWKAFQTPLRNDII